MGARLKVSYAAAASAGAAIAAIGGLASCVGDDTAVTGSNDASVPEQDTGVVTTPDAGIDSTIADSGSDAADSAPAIDAADAGFDAGCSPVATLTGFTVPAYVHAAQHQYFCTDPIIDQSFAAACEGDASTYTSCTTFPATDEDGGLTPECQACLISPENSDAGYAATVLSNGVPLQNVAGCIELADPSDAGLSCAMAIQAVSACTEFACKSSCPVSDGPSAAAYLTCVSAAAAGVCHSYVLVAQGCIATENADAGAGVQTDPQRWCVGTPDPVQQLTQIADYFCRS